MQVTSAVKLVGALTLGVGAAVALSACQKKAPSEPTGPLQPLVDDVFTNLHEGAFEGARRLSLATESTRVITREDGFMQGAWDGRKLLQAADSHAYGTPRLTDPAVDVKDDGYATPNEVREVLRHFDVDESGGYSPAEAKALEGSVGMRWIPINQL